MTIIAEAMSTDCKQHSYLLDKHVMSQGMKSDVSFVPELSVCVCVCVRECMRACVHVCVCTLPKPKLTHLHPCNALTGIRR